MLPFEPGPLEIAHLRTKELKAAKGRREGVLIAIPDEYTDKQTASKGLEEEGDGANARRDLYSLEGTRAR